MFKAPIVAGAVLHEALPRIISKFPFPKSLYATMECIKAVIHNKDNAIILDFFAGSGTTLIAAKELEFNSIGVELSEEYCKIIQDRINAVTSPLEQIL